MRLHLDMTEYALVVRANPEPAIFKPLRTHLLNEHNRVANISDMVFHQVSHDCQQFGVLFVPMIALSGFIFVVNGFLHSFLIFDIDSP